MATAVYSKISIDPQTEDDFFSFGDLIEEMMNSREYFINANTINGARFYSENFTFNVADKMFEKYKAVVRYFGGGEVRLYETSDCAGEDFELVKLEKC